MMISMMTWTIRMILFKTAQLQQNIQGKTWLSIRTDGRADEKHSDVREKCGRR